MKNGYTPHATAAIPLPQPVPRFQRLLPVIPETRTAGACCTDTMLALRASTLSSPATIAAARQQHLATELHRRIHHVGTVPSIARRDGPTYPSRSWPPNSPQHDGFINRQSQSR